MKGSKRSQRSSFKKNVKLSLSKSTVSLASLNKIFEILLSNHNKFLRLLQFCSWFLIFSENNLNIVNNHFDTKLTLILNFTLSCICVPYRFGPITGDLGIKNRTVFSRNKTVNEPYCTVRGKKSKLKSSFGFDTVTFFHHKTINGRVYEVVRGPRLQKLTINGVYTGSY